MSGPETNNKWNEPKDSKSFLSEIKEMFIFTQGRFKDVKKELDKKIQNVDWNNTPPENNEQWIIEETREALNKLLREDILKPGDEENTPSYISSQDTDENNAKALSDSNQEDAKKPGWYIPPFDIIPNDDWDKSDEKNKVVPKWWETKITSDSVIAYN